jgi:hypothetical protein
VNDWLEAGAVDFMNVHQGLPLGTPSSASGSASPAGLTVGAAPGDLVLDALAYSGSASNAVRGAGQTVRWADSSDGNWKGAGSTKPGGASSSMSWTTPAAWAQMAVAVRAVVG